MSLRRLAPLLCGFDHRGVGVEGCGLLYEFGAVATTMADKVSVSCELSVVQWQLLLCDRGCMRASGRCYVYCSRVEVVACIAQQET